MPPSRRDFLSASAAAAVAAALGRPLAALAAQVPQAQPLFTPIRRNVGTFTMRGGTIGWLSPRAACAAYDRTITATRLRSVRACSSLMS